MVKFGLGQPIERTEDRRFLVGAGRFTDDIDLPGQVHAFVVRSPHAHARILSLNYERALDNGAIIVFTHSDLAADGIGLLPCSLDVPGVDGGASFVPPRPALADGVARFVGDPVALVVAETAAAAQDAAELVVIDYAELPSSCEPEEALAPGAPVIWSDAPDNLCFHWHRGDPVAVGEAFANAAHVTRIELVNNRVIPCPMEPRCAIGEFQENDSRYVLYTPSQGANLLRDQLAQTIFRVHPACVRVVTCDVGGGFGTRFLLYPEHVLVTWAARQLRRPVKWRGDRNESFLSDSHARDHRTNAEMALDADGRIIAIRVTTSANIGAYVSNFAPFVASSAGSGMLTGTYRIPAIYNEVRGAFTNTAPVDAYRGAGRPEAIYVLERLIDLAARERDESPIEFRRRNLIGPEDMPHTTVFGHIYDSGDFPRNLVDAANRVDWNGHRERRAAAQRRGRLSGIGAAMYIEDCGESGSEWAQIKVEPRGTTVSIGTQSSGQGHATAYAQVVSQLLGIPFHQIEIVQGDTDVIPEGGGTGNSRSMPVGSFILGIAARQIIDKGRDAAARMLEVAAKDLIFADGVFTVVGTDRRVALSRLAAEAGLSDRDGEAGLTGGGSASLDACTFPNGCHICEVEIDHETGDVQIIRYTAVNDFGTVVNPLMAAGQVHGGVAQGIGQAVHERTVYETESGQLLTASFLDYGLPRADDLPMFDVAFNVVPCTTNPLGLKGAGEAGTIAATPAVVNAIVDALSPFGVRHLDMPVTREALWRLVNGKPRP